MTQPARKVVDDIESTTEVRGMRVASWATYSVATYAKHFASAAVAARTSNRVEPCGWPVIIRRTWRSRPSGRMWISPRRIEASNAFAVVTVHAEQWAVTDHAGAWVGRSLHVVHREEIGAMHRLAHGCIEGEP